MVRLTRPFRAARSEALSWSNVELLMWLRWLAVAGQLVTILLVETVLDVRLPLVPLLAAPVVLILVNLGSIALLNRRHRFSQGELYAALTIDVEALCWQLYHSGGATNPFTTLFLLQIVIGAIILEARWSVLVAVNTSLCMLLLLFAHVPLDFPNTHANEPFGLYLVGSLLCFLLSAVLLVVFVGQLNRNRRTSERELSKLRQQATEEAHIVRMGLLASGAAHELGTPLSSLSVVLGDWSRIPAIAQEPDLLADIADMQRELQRCKAVVGSILMSAGELRGEDPQVEGLRSLLGDIVTEWRPRAGGIFLYEDGLGEDLDVISDPGLQQVIGNVLDNALEASPAYVRMAAVREGTEGLGDLVITVEDRGPGFSASVIGRIGQPYISTKGSEGRGVGLFLTANVLRTLGGRLAVANRAEGGAQVRLTIPLEAIAWQPAEAQRRKT
ncbi:ATP-binding protein [Novosphingobium sp. 9]|uniref:ATP-binding protein n=1 Tax=Novosphingobium sp. 9 TaxID=2025349 RepID=UPI0021B6A869|nr:ATP-binding protein [Novosphingobium sp. 9]